MCCKTKIELYYVAKKKKKMALALSDRESNKIMISYQFFIE